MEPSQPQDTCFMRRADYTKDRALHPSDNCTIELATYKWRKEGSSSRKWTVGKIKASGPKGLQLVWPFIKKSEFKWKTHLTVTYNKNNWSGKGSWFWFPFCPRHLLPMEEWACLWCSWHVGVVPIHTGQPLGFFHTFQGHPLSALT